MKNKNDNQLPPKLLYVTRLALAVLIFSVLGVFLYVFQPSWFKLGPKEPQPELVPDQTEVNIATTTEACSDCVRRLIDGVLVKPELQKLRPYAITIDNFDSARPQFGLGSASLVYELPVEGGVTRYLAIFSPDNLPNEIGPVRSARPYILNLAKEIGATYVHAGGSPEAMLLARDLGKSNFDEFFNGSYFYRSDKRSAPHNLLISGDNLIKYREDKNESGSELESWQFKDSPTSTPAVVSRIDLKYQDGYASYWQYDQETNSYQRYQDKKTSSDDQGNNIKAKNVIIHVVPFRVLDDKSRLQMSSAFSGSALLCQDGNCQLGNWKKNSASKRAKYYYKTGEEFIFNAGPTWVEMVNDWSYVSY